MPKPKSTGTGIKKRKQQVNQDEVANLTGDETAKEEEVTELEVAQQVAEDQLVEDEVVEDQLVEYELVEDQLVEYEVVGDELVEDELVKDELVKDELVENEVVEDELVKDEDTLSSDATKKNVEISESGEDVVVEQPLTNEAKKSEVKLETGLHFTDGEKGGVGKSLFCRVLLEYCKSKGLSDRIQFVESDISNPDVGRIYYSDEKGGKNYIEAEFTNEEKKRSSADKIFELATEKTVIVNLPSNIYSSVTDWFERNHIATLAKDQNIKIYKWFVCNGGHSSIDKFKESVNDKKLKDITHIFVRNQVIFDDWTIIEQDKDLAKILARENVFQMDFPQFSFEERNRVDAGQLTFSKALADNSGFGILSKQRIKNFLNATYAELDRLNLLP